MIFNRITIRRFFFIGYILFSGIGHVYSQAYNFKQLSIQNGLPQSQAFDILFDEYKRAWIATQGGGVCRFDGSEFLYLTKSDSLISNRVFSLFESDEEIWIGQRGGVSVFTNEGRFIRNLRFHDPATTVVDIIRHREVFYFATNKGVFSLDKNQLTPYDRNVNLLDLNVVGFFVDQHDDLWACTSQGLLHINDPFTKINKARGLPVNEVECAVVFNDQILIGTYGAGVMAYSKNKGVFRPNEMEKYSEEIITTMYRSSESQVWIGTLNHGVFVYDDFTKTLKNYSVENGLANNHVKSIISDNWNNIWIGTSGGGISIFQNSPFVKYDTQTGLNGNYIYAALNDSQNNKWVGTDGGGVVRINDTSAVVLDEEYGFCSDKVRCIFEDYSGDIWLGTESGGIGIYSPSFRKDTIIMYTQKSGLTSNWIKSFAQLNTSNEIHIATVNGGIMKAKKNEKFPLEVSFSKLKDTNKELPQRINYLFTFSGKVWFLGDENIYGFYDKKKIERFEIDDVNLRNAAVSENKIWLGTFDNGVLELTMNDDSAVSQKWINVTDGLSSNNVYQLVIKENQLWIGTEKGLDRVELNDSGLISKIVHFGPAEGFQGLETNHNAASLDDQGNLWFGTVNGLFAYSGADINYDQQSPPYLRINDFRIYYESIEKTIFADAFDQGEMVKPLILPHDMNHIGFSFKAIHYAQTENIRYRWFLSGVDRDWTPPSTVNEATYGNLLPGSYTFFVKASTDGNWEVEPITVSFEIDSPYWEKWWFKLVYFSAVFVGIVLLFLLGYYRLRAKNRRLQERLEMEKNLIELEQKALRLQMNPHFIFNVLNSIHNLIILNDPDKARYALSKFSKLMRRVLENSREKFISIDDEIETLQNYIQLERLTAEADVELKFSIDPSIDSSEKILPPLMIQPFVENALIHGLKGLNKIGIIQIHFTLIGENILECSIEDNGRGRADAEQVKSQKENYHKSTALRVTQERLASMNSEAKFTPFEIIDLTDNNGNPSGTKVIFRLEI